MYDILTQEEINELLVEPLSAADKNKIDKANKKATNKNKSKKQSKQTKQSKSEPDMGVLDIDIDRDFNTDNPFEFSYPTHIDLNDPNIIVTEKSFRILALDQATKISGYAIFDDGKLFSCGKLDSCVKNGSATERLEYMYFLIKDLVKRIKPDIVVIEDVQYQANQNTYKQLAQLQGLIFALMFEEDMAFNVCSPSVWKAYCGIKGRKREEQKANAIKMVKDKFGIDAEEDVSEAICIGIWSIGNVKKR